jgi:hypothetical protein
MNVHMYSLHSVPTELLLELGKVAVGAKLRDGCYHLVDQDIAINEQHLILAGALVWEGSFDYKRFLVILQKIN